jgi:hypothetical protein
MDTEKIVKRNKDGSERRGGSGRTKGSVSLVTVKFSELKSRFKDEDLIVVGSKFCQKAGIGDTFKSISEPTPTEGVTLTPAE